MDQHFSRSSLMVAESDRPQAAETISQEEQQEAKQSKDYISSIIGWILQMGVMLSAGIILIGLLMLPFYGKGLSLSELLTFPRTFSQIWSGLWVLQPESIIALGLLLLIATPVLRVVTSVVVFALERDKKYVIITLMVLAILLSSLFFGQDKTTTIHLSNQVLPHFSMSTFPLDSCCVKKIDVLPK